jgi:glutathione S-transferase
MALAAALGYVDFRLSAQNWRTSRPLLAAWVDAFSQRTSVQATLPIG